MKKLGQKNIFLPINIMFQLINLPLLLSQKALDKCCIQCFQNSNVRRSPCLVGARLPRWAGDNPLCVDCCYIILEIALQNSEIQSIYPRTSRCEWTAPGFLPPSACLL